MFKQRVLGIVGGLLFLAISVVIVGTLFVAHDAVAPKPPPALTETATPSPFPTPKVMASITPLYIPTDLSVTPLAAYVGDQAYNIPGNVPLQPYMKPEWWEGQIEVNLSLQNQILEGNNYVEYGRALEVTGDAYLREDCFYQAYGTFGAAIVFLTEAAHPVEHERILGKMREIYPRLVETDWHPTCVSY